VHDQPAGHPVQGHGQCDRVIEAEAVRTCRPGRPGGRPVHHETMNLARVRRLGPEDAYRVDDHGERRPGPGLDQPAGLAVGDHQFHVGRHEVAQLIDDRGTGAVVAPELVADADHHDQLAAGT
jgi:hypothetical protein